MSPSLPNQPSLDHLRYQARDLQRDFEAGKEEALRRVREGLGSPCAKPGERLKLAQAQCVIAREHGFPSWPKLRDAVLARGRDGGEEEDPLHVRYASYLLLGAADMGMLEFVLCRRDGQLVVEAWGESHPLAEFVRCCASDSFWTERQPVPADAVWERLLVMAELVSPTTREGVIRFGIHARYPYTEWIISVSRLAPDRLRFELELDRVDTVPPSPKTGERQTPGDRMAARVREAVPGPLSPEAEAALRDVSARYDAATFHRGAIREVAALLPAATANLDAIVCCAQLVGMFGYHTGALVDIARIASGCPSPHPEFVQLAELAVRRLWGTLEMVRLARELAGTQGEEDIARIRQEIAGIDATADFPNLEAAWDQREDAR